MGAFGLNGYVKVNLETDFLERLSPGETLRVGPTMMTVEDLTLDGHKVRLKLFEVADRTAAESLIGAPIYAKASEIDLPEDEFHVKDLIGCKVVDSRRGQIGVVQDVVAKPGQDLLIVGDSLIPFVKAFVSKVDICGRLIDVDLPVGLAPDDQEDQ